MNSYEGISDQGRLDEKNNIDAGRKSQISQSRSTLDEYVTGGKAEVISGGQGEVPRRILIKHTNNSSVTFTEGTADDTNGYKAYNAFANAGVKVIYCQGPIERTVNGNTVTRTEAFTAPDGTVYVSSESSLPPKQTFDHEIIHIADKTNNPAYADYESVLYENADYSSDTYKEIVAKINRNQFNNKYDIDDIDSYPIFMREIAAYINQFILSDPEFAESTFGGMFSNWDEVVNAVNEFNKNTQADFNGSADFMPGGEEDESVGLSEPTVKEIYREPTQKEMDEGIFGKQKDAKQRHIIDIAKKLDSCMTVVFVDPDNEKLSGRAGVFMHDTNTMFLSNDNSVVGMYCQLFKHEFVHRLESKGAYQSFKNYLLKHSSAFENYARAKLKEINGTEFDGTREEALKAFSDYYIGLVQKGDFTAEYKRNFTAEYAEREMVADFIGEVLFKGKENRKDVAQSLSDSDMASILNMEDTLAEFEELSETDRNWFQKIIDTIKDWIASLKGIKQNERLVNDLEYIEKRLSRVLDSKDIKKAASRAVDRQFYINDDFYNRLNKWDKKTIGFSFVLGKTSEALKLAGIPDKQIRWDASKIKNLLNKHSGMTIGVIKQIPELLENPIIVIDSKQDTNSKIIMGDLYDAHNKIVTVVLLLSPTSKSGNVLDIIKISSAEGRGHIQSLFKKKMVHLLQLDIKMKKESAIG